MSLLLAFPLVTGALGVWQLRRLDQKTQLQQALDAQPLVCLAGSFVPAVCRIGPRAFPVPYTKSAVGYYVIQPFVCADGCTVLVNRGWAPRGTEIDCPQVYPLFSSYDLLIPIVIFHLPFQLSYYFHHRHL